MPLQDGPYALIIHGGVFYRSLTAGNNFKPQEEKLRGLKHALLAGFAILDNRGSSLDAVQAAVKALESMPFFNAGRGSVLTDTGVYELDAGIMDGATGRAGGAATVLHVKHPIDLARKILESSQVLLTGKGAELFAQEYGLDLVANDYFDNPRAYSALREVKRGGSSLTISEEEPQVGTVGAVALDIKGHLAAASSTGGLSNKSTGRIGDTPIAGAGFYADEQVAVACTGVGEMFMVPPAAYGVSMLVNKQNISLEMAVKRVLSGELSHQALEGGMIALDREGQVTVSYNTPWMYRAWMKQDGTYEIAVGPEAAETGHWPTV